YIAAPQRRCMQCMGQFKPEDVSLEQSGLLENPVYVKGLPAAHFANRGENVYTFSMSLAGLQMQQFLSYVLTPKGVYYGPKEMDFVTGNIDQDFKLECDDNCSYNKMTGFGDHLKDSLIQRHPVAELSRQKALKYSTSNYEKVSWIRHLKNYF